MTALEDVHAMLDEALGEQPHEALDLAAHDMRLALVNRDAAEIEAAEESLGRALHDLAGTNSERGWWRWTETRRLAREAAKEIREKKNPW